MFHNQNSPHQIKTLSSNNHHNIDNDNIKIEWNQIPIPQEQQQVPPGQQQQTPPGEQQQTPPGQQQQTPPGQQQQTPPGQQQQTPPGQQQQAPPEQPQQVPPGQGNGQAPNPNPQQTPDQNDGQNNQVTPRPTNGSENEQQQPNPEPVLQYLSSLAIDNKNFNLINLSKRQISILAIASTNTISTLLRLNPSRIERFTMSTPNNRYWVTQSFLKIGILTNTTQTSQCNPDVWNKENNEDSSLSTGLVFNFRINATETELKESIGIRTDSRQLQNSPNSQYFSNFLRDKLIQDSGKTFFQLNYYFILEVGKSLNVPENELNSLANYFNNSPNETTQLSCARVHYIGNNLEQDNSIASTSSYVKFGSVDESKAIIIIIPFLIVCLIGIFAMFVRNFTCKDNSEETIKLNENV